MYIIMWEFKVRPERVGEFVLAYNADGDWAQLFRLAEGYRGTELLASTEDVERFVTIDRWDKAEDFVLFQESFSQQYHSLDARLEGLTLSEIKLGTFSC
jgi:heme-degrading monooxygenase HmoA